MPLFAQTSIDKPAATFKLTRQEVISVRQLRADIDRLENATGAKLTVDQRKDVLDARINSMLFLQFCEREKISVSDAQVNAAVAQLRSQLGSNATMLIWKNHFEPLVYLSIRQSMCPAPAV
jgi:hypothetical protein